MKSKYMRYETGARAGVAPLSVKASSTISKMTTVQILTHLYRRHEIFILYLMLFATFTWVFVTKLG